MLKQLEADVARDRSAKGANESKDVDQIELWKSGTKEFFRMNTEMKQQIRFLVIVLNGDAIRRSKVSLRRVEYEQKNMRLCFIVPRILVYNDAGVWNGQPSLSRCSQEG
ncbi:hypothetical protein RRSWK_04275 [Rhodopirellula sp. SWK7]|nr:hypothetical protein RRSWK_04275 [Rhodopirellula sp. SWK7]